MTDQEKRDEKRDERREALREALLRAAEAMIAAEGLAGLKARALARAAGCAVGAIYTVFPDLDALVLAVNLRTLSLFEAALGSAPATVLDGPEAAADALVGLSAGYLAFARAEPLLWDALFRHRSAAGAAARDWYVAEQDRLFRFIEAPLAVLRPDLGPEERALLARSLFSATHGIVALGLDPERMALPPEVIRRQLEVVVRAMAAGLRAAAP